MKTNNKGFSLVELIVVIAIMAILAAVAIPTFAGFITKANVASDASFINDVEYVATVANAGENPGKAVTVYVTLGTDGAVASVTYTVAGNSAVTLEKTPSTPYTGISKDIYDSIDWSYTFKSQKTGAWKLSDDAKSIVANSQ